MANRVILGFVCALAAAGLQAATLTVTNTNDAGSGSLRQAILDSNGNGSGSTDLIEFHVPNGGLTTITPITALPQIVTPVTIDGYTEDGTVANSNPPTAANNAVVTITLDGSNRSFHGLDFATTATNSKVRGLVVLRFDIGIRSLAAITITGNIIGMNQINAAGLGNGRGILLDGTTNAVVGGATPAAMNIISGNEVGIHVVSCQATTIAGNRIGTTRNGDGPVGSSEGIYVVGSEGTTIDRNLVSGHNVDPLAAGITLQGDTTNTAITSNFVGTARDGETPIPNNFGIQFLELAAKQPTGNFIGRVNQGNVIAHNEFDGVRFLAMSSVYAVRNSIRYNDLHGNGAADLVHQSLSIDLDDDGITSNDTGDADTGSNERQNIPQVLTAQQALAGDVAVSGIFNSHASTQYVIQVHRGVACHSSGFGDGAYAAEATITTDAGGNAAFNIVTPVLPSGGIISATATDPLGNTSEFSPCVPITSAATPSLSIDDLSITEEDSGTTTATFTVSLSAASALPITVQVTVSGQTATAGSDFAPSSMLLTFPPGVGTRTFDVAILNDTIPEPEETFLVTLSSPTNATIADGQGVGTIVNDDTAPVAVTPIPFLDPFALAAVAAVLLALAVYRLR